VGLNSRANFFMFELSTRSLVKFSSFVDSRTLFLKAFILSVVRGDIMLQASGLVGFTFSGGSMVYLRVQTTDFLNLFFFCFGIVSVNFSSTK